ncbi:putative protein OS=Lysinibacillus sphaericus OX=1421 GN=LS41612_08855 PE=4 SV=1 [Lysinibacillus sphaericus]
MIEYLDIIKVGTDSGEWGAEFKEIADSTEFFLKKCNIKSIFEYKGELFFLESLEHMYLNTGSLYKIEYDGTGISIKEY